MTVQEFSKISGMNRQRIQYLIKIGKIKCKKVKGAYVITESEAEKYLGRPIYRPNKLHEYIKRLTAYNKRHGTAYSYGQRVAMDLI